MNIFTQIENWINGPPAPDGWATVEVAHTLAAIALAIRPNVCIEIGVFGGRSLIPVAMALKQNGSGVIHGIDPWSAGESVKGQSGKDKEWWSSQKMHQDVYERFIANVHKLGVHNHVEIHRVTSDEYPADRGSIDLLTIDGNHGPQALVDIKRFTPHVSVGGFVYLDDLHWDGEHVSAGLDWMTERGFVKLYELGTGAILQRVLLNTAS